MAFWYPSHEVKDEGYEWRLKSFCLKDHDLQISLITIGILKYYKSTDDVKFDLKNVNLDFYMRNEEII